MPAEELAGDAQLQLELAMYKIHPHHLVELGRWALLVVEERNKTPPPQA